MCVKVVAVGAVHYVTTMHKKQDLVISDMTSIAKLHRCSYDE